MEFEIRHLRTLDEYEAAVALQYATWGPDFAGCVPVSLLKVTQRIGGVTGGAFAATKELAGCVYGITGIQNNTLVHWSDILAVRQGYRGYGLGKRLKWFQRAELLKIGVRTMRWSYDPLQALNANLNLNALGAQPIEYVENMYGDTGSALHVGLGTDRFVVQWALDSDAVSRLAQGDRIPARMPSEAPVVNTRENGNTRRPDVGADLPQSPSVLVEIPASINEAKKEDATAGGAWRRSTRRAFQHYLDRGYAVTAFGEFRPGRFGYCLEKEARG